VYFGDRIKYEKNNCNGGDGVSDYLDCAVSAD